MANRKEQGKSILSSLWDDYDNNRGEKEKRGMMIRKERDDDESVERAREISVLR